MGARGSKTKPTDESPSRRGTFQTLIVTMDPAKECEDEVRAPHSKRGYIQSSENEESRADADSSVNKVSKVQEILEGKIELKKHQQQLEHLPNLPLPTATLDLQFSSSEDSEDSGSGRQKRRGAKKKRKKRRYSGGAVASSTSATASPLKGGTIKTTSSPVKSKMDSMTSLQKQQQNQASAPVKEYFEEISDAYALTEYAGKPAAEDDSLNATPQSTEQPHQERSHSPTKLQPVVNSPSSSPSKYFGGAFDNWKKPTLSLRSSRSIIMETRDVSRGSPPKSATSDYSTLSAKQSNSSRTTDRVNGLRLANYQQPGASYLESELDDLDSGYSSNRGDSYSSPAPRNHGTETKVVEERTAMPAAPISKPKRPNLRIDDMDESIMDNILAEVVA